MRPNNNGMSTVIESLSSPQALAVTTKVAALFPGQGAYDGASLSGVFAAYPECKQTFSQIDSVAQRQLGLCLSDVLAQPNPPTLAELLAHSPKALQFAIYGISVATYRLLQAQGLSPDILIGHSFGEIAALVCAGAFTVAEGAEIVGHRMDALQAMGSVDGYMAAIGSDAGRTGALLDCIRDAALGIAVENSPSQTVVSGPTNSLTLLSELAATLKIPFVRIASPYPFHSPLMQPAVADFAARLRSLEARPLTVPVYSPILGRLYTDADTLTECLARHLVEPVRFSNAIFQAQAEGINVFVECGALETHTKLVKSVAGSPDVTAIACLPPKRDATASLTLALETLRGLGVLPTVLHGAAADSLLPDADKAIWEAFWAAHGQRFLADIRREFEGFEKLRCEPLMPSQETRATPSPLGGARSRATLFQELAALYAEALEYPVEVFTDEVELEAELGIDSVKQTELFTRVSERYHLSARPADFRLSDYCTMGQITDFVFNQCR